VGRGGNTLLTSNVLVLSLGPAVDGSFPGVGVGAVVRISTRSMPALPDARNAIAGGPALVHNGRLQKVRVAPDAPYEMSSLLERHPRTAVGWNDQVIYLAQVDGRQKDWSVGMTADELAEYLLKLGCTEAINLDGGGSSCLWFAGQIRNHPCDGFERSVANSLIVFDQQSKATAGNPLGSTATRPGERSASSGN
jgi:exopolysaccharide biosynthesis protein